MIDTRFNKMAQVIAHYSLRVRPGQMVYVWGTSTEATPLMLECYREILKAGGNAYLRADLQGAEEIFFAHASDSVLDQKTPVDWLSVEEGKFDAYIRIGADVNTRRLSAVDGQAFKRQQAAMGPITRKRMNRSSTGTDYPWLVTRYPTNAYAMESEMSLNDYAEFLFSACLVNDPDPVASWTKVGNEQQRLCDWLNNRKQLHVRGSNVDLKVSIDARKWVNCCGRRNFPDGEIYTGPHEGSAEGWVRYSYPAIYYGREVAGVELTFKDGLVVKETAKKNEEFLTATLNTDPGARRIGEFAIGTNYGVKRMTRDILFDEKIGGTMHIAVGNGYPETGNRNESAVHWDMITDLSDSEIAADGEVFYRNGKFLI
jgi:aminopeptidase